MYINICVCVGGGGGGGGGADMTMRWHVLLFSQLQLDFLFVSPFILCFCFMSICNVHLN